MLSFEFKDYLPKRKISGRMVLELPINMQSKLRNVLKKVCPPLGIIHLIGSQNFPKN